MLSVARVIARTTLGFYAVWVFSVLVDALGVVDGVGILWFRTTLVLWIRLSLMMRVPLLSPVDWWGWLCFWCPGLNGIDGFLLVR